MKFCRLVLLGGLDPKKNILRKKKKFVQPGVKCILNTKNVASKNRSTSTRGTLHRMVPIMEEDLCRGVVYLTVLCGHIPTLFPYFLVFRYPHLFMTLLLIPVRNRRRKRKRRGRRGRRRRGRCGS